MKTTHLTEEASVNAMEVKKRGQLSYIWFRFRKNKLAMFGLLLLLAMALICITAPLYLDYDRDVVTQHVMEKFAPPLSEGHLMGTDHYGRDMLARIVYGGRISLTMGFAIVSLSLLFGGMIGALAGYYGGWVDNVLMRLMDVFLAIPQILMAMAIVAVLGTDIKNLLIAMTIANVPKFARIVRSAILQIQGQEYIEAAQACGTRDLRIIVRHILPNAIGPIVVQATLQIAQSIISLAALSFIGLGVQSPQPEWGTMLSEGKQDMRLYPFVVLEPGIAIMLAVLSFNLMGDGLRDALDPKLKN
jgi:peptide/nickel transport system permease protein